MRNFWEWIVISVLARFFPNRYRLIPGSHGKPLLRQFKLTNWAYLQSFVNPEETNWFHVHRWNRMISFVLSGSFIEERYPGNCYIQHKAPSIYAMDRTVIHRLHQVESKTWTLFLMLDNRKDWGYFPRPENVGYVPFEEFIPESSRVKSL